MVIDFILDRKEGTYYDPYDFYSYLMQFENPEYQAISYAMDYGTEQDVKKALCNYIDGEGYNPDIKDFINANNWLS